VEGLKELKKAEEGSNENEFRFLEIGNGDRNGGCPGRRQQRLRRDETVHAVSRG
jgi:hypothetical protein